LCGEGLQHQHDRDESYGHVVNGNVRSWGWRSQVRRKEVIGEFASDRSRVLLDDERNERSEVRLYRAQRFDGQ
jgi:hypothetical protein